MGFVLIVIICSAVWYGLHKSERVTSAPERVPAKSTQNQTTSAAQISAPKTTKTDTSSGEQRMLVSGQIN